MKRAAVVFWSVAYVSCAVWTLTTSDPLPRWLFALLCMMLAIGQVTAHVSERITNDTARTKAITEALKVLGKRAESCDAAGDPAGALVLLDAAEAVGKLTDSEGP